MSKLALVGANSANKSGFVLFLNYDNLAILSKGRNSLRTWARGKPGNCSKSFGYVIRSDNICCRFSGA